MKSFLIRSSCSLCLVLLLAIAGRAQSADPIADATRQMTSLPGYFPLFWDEAQGKLWMVVDKWDTEFLYVNSLAAGVGSNDIGLDRGQLGDDRIVYFRRVGPKVLLMQPNYNFRAVTSDPAERAAVEQSFAQAVLWGFSAEKSSGNRALIDVSAFVMRDSHGIAKRLRRMNEGEFKLDASRSAVFLDRTKNFPRNTEVEATVTFVTEKDPGRMLASVTPSSDEFTVRLHHSFIELPDAGYTPRRFDPRSGYGAVSFVDYAAPIEESIEKRWIPRHRLQKKNPAAALSEPVEAIVYYVDRGAPEPVRTALLEGARWWNEAFEAAGYKDAFRVELMPEGADPMDVRYNVIQWVHRSTRGWSYGSSVRDPRTGEIIKGHVSLGSLRVRQDYLIATGLLAPYEDGVTVPAAMREMALARLRQLSAHEVGHTLGLAHNFAASINNRASVMDYPHPYVALGENGVPGFSQAYATGIGEWDKVTIAYGYAHFADSTGENKALAKILDDASAKGLRYITDRDSRPEGGASPVGHLWDNGADAADELLRLSKVRRAALERFSEKVLRNGEPIAAMAETLVPVYLLHRYQVEAAAKVVGGLEYTYAVRGSASASTSLISPERQQKAITALLDTLQPAFLALPERVMQLIPPHPPGYGPSRESFPSRTGLTFDPLAAAAISADHSVSFLFNPQRAARLVQYAARDGRQPGLASVLDQALHRTLKASPQSGLNGELQRTVNSVLLYRMMVLARTEQAPEQVKAIAWSRLTAAKAFLESAAAEDESWKAHYAWAAERIRRFQSDPKEITLPKPQEAPPGQPIGCGDKWPFAMRDDEAH